MSKGLKKLSQEAIDVLDSMEVEGNAAKITAGQLDRKLYQEVNAALAQLGGKWNTKAKAHLFPGDPRDAIEQVTLDGCWTDTKKEFDFFPTPKDLAERLVKIADVKPGMKALEPSAGTGVIADALKAAGCKVHCVEKQGALSNDLREKHDYVTHSDFLEWPTDFSKYDCVVMNPPFSRNQDIRHITHAFTMLKPGGRLVSVAGAGVKFRQTKEARAFRELVEAHGYIEDLPEGSFKGSGTMVNTVMVVLNKE